MRPPRSPPPSRCFPGEAVSQFRSAFLPCPPPLATSANDPLFCPPIGLVHPRRQERESDSAASSATECQPAHRPRTTSMPWRICARGFRPRRPTLSVSNVRSSAMICDTFATESFGNPVVLLGSNTLPGAPAHTVLLVSGTHTTVAMRLRFRGFPWMTTTGRRKPGPDPLGSGKSAHQMSPCEISTTQRPEAPAARPAARTHPVLRRRVDRPRCSSPR